jgi:hypothetical protein
MSKFSFISLRRTIFSIGFFLFWSGLPPNRPGIPVKPVGIPVRTDYTTCFEFKFEFVWFPTGSRPNRTGKPVPDLAGSVRSVGSVSSSTSCRSSGLLVGSSLPIFRRRATQHYCKNSAPSRQQAVQTAPHFILAWLMALDQTKIKRELE